MDNSLDHRQFAPEGSLEHNAFLAARTQDGGTDETIQGPSFFDLLYQKSELVKWIDVIFNPGATRGEIEQAIGFIFVEGFTAGKSSETNPEDLWDEE